MNFGQAVDALALEAAVQSRAGELRDDGLLLGIKTVVER
jgi:hypothetical protein